MGKRFATSKYCYSDVMHTFPASFGFKGEALSSISDLSLLEIITKTHGMPNGYRMVLKDGKCLYLDIDDCRQENLKNYLIPRAMLSSRVDEDSHKWIDAGNLGKTDELIRKNKSRSHTTLPFYDSKKKFFASSESSRKAAGNNNIKTVHDEPLMPETRAVRRLHHSAEAIWSELPWLSSHQCDQSSTPSCGDSVFSDVRSSVKMKLVNI